MNTSSSDGSLCCQCNPARAIRRDAGFERLPVAGRFSHRRYRGDSIALIAFQESKAMKR